MRILIENHDDNSFKRYAHRWNTTSDQIIDWIYNWILQQPVYSNIKAAVEDASISAEELINNSNELIDIIQNNISILANTNADPRQFENVLCKSRSFKQQLTAMNDDWSCYSEALANELDNKLESLEES